MKSDCIDYRDLPGQNRLFLTFLYDFAKVSSYYQPLPSSRDEWKKRVRVVLDSPSFPRLELVHLLDDYNRGLEVPAESLRNLELLSRPDTVAVVTGQQVGLLGGPSFALYKAATAIRLVRRLRSWGIPAVPVFWLASDDSDFNEIASTDLLSPSDGEILNLAHPDPRGRKEQMAGTVALGSDENWWRGTLSLLEKALPDQSLRGGLLSAYQPGRTFREAFARWMSRVFSTQGLVFFDPLLPGYRDGLRNFFKLAVERRPELVDALLARNAEISEAGFSPQVHIDQSETLLFWLRGMERYKLDYQNDAYRAKGLRRLQLTGAELLSALSDGSALVAPNVLLRPIVQDYLLPTAVGVTGPSEVAYFSQVNAIARFWNKELLITPRLAFSIVGRKSGRLLAKYGLTPETLLTSSLEDLTERVLRQGESRRVLERVDDLRLCLEDKLISLKESLEEIDAPVAAMMEKAAGKIRHQVERVNHRYIMNRQEQDQVLRRHLTYLRNNLLPKGHLQERVVNFNYFLNEGGPDFLETLIQADDQECPSHRVIYL
jgi:bacillithiol biosynthesis cysteine-adding enzyme BshC